MKISEEIINQIRERTNIIATIGEFVHLKAAGKNYKGLCPFHSEKTPSFMVSPQKGIFHCFGCGAGGNVFNFLMKFKGISFPDAVRYLGERIGIRIDSDRNAGTPFEIFYGINELAVQFFQKNLFSDTGNRASDYLKKRNLSTSTLREFHVGYAPEDWDALFSHLRSREYKTETIEESGLIVKRKKSPGYYDRFRNRVMFPIQDTLGRFIGFGGRTIDFENPNIPKYINSNENQLFHKGKHLFGLVIAQEHIRKEGSAIVVEGYVDVVRMHQEGFRHTVAPLGTALTEDQISLLMRHTRCIFLAFDPDEAGTKAALRSISLFHKKGIDPLIIRLPRGRDPGDFFDEYTREEFKLLLREAVPGVQFIVHSSVDGKKEYTANEKIAILARLADFFNIENDILKIDLARNVSEALGIDESVLRRELDRLKTVQTAPRQGTARRKGESGIANEFYLLLLILGNPEQFPLAKGRLDEHHFRGKWSRSLWRSILQASERGHWDSAAVFEYLHHEKFIEYLSGRLMDEALSVRPKEQLIDAIATVKERWIRGHLEHINNLLEKAELENDEGTLAKLISDKQVYTAELAKARHLRSTKTFLSD